MKYAGGSEVPTLWGEFTTFSSVTIKVVKADDDTNVTLTSNACTQSTQHPGMFYWSATNITTPPSTFTEYVARMTDSVYGGVVTFKFSLKGVEANLDQALSVMEDNIRGADDDDLKNISDEIAAIPATDLSGVLSAVQRLFDDNQRAVLYYATAEIAGRKVPANGVSHMRVDVKAEGDADFSSPVETVYIVFTYQDGATVVTPPATHTRADAAPSDGTFTTEPFAS